MTHKYLITGLIILIFLVIAAFFARAEYIGMWCHAPRAIKSLSPRIDATAVATLESLMKGKEDVTNAAS